MPENEKPPAMRVDIYYALIAAIQIVTKKISERNSYGPISITPLRERESTAYRY